MDSKPKLEHHEAVEDPYAGLTPEDAECWRRYQGKEGKKVVRKVGSILPLQIETIADILLLQIDFRLISVLGVLYLLSHIDRGNIGNAKIEGMDKDIGLTGNQYNIASTIFFVPYILFGKLVHTSTIHQYPDSRQKSHPTSSSRRSDPAGGLQRWSFAGVSS